jgi:hypothetical protein
VNPISARSLPGFGAAAGRPIRPRRDAGVAGS